MADPSSTNALLIEQYLGAAFGAVVRAQAMAAREMADLVEAVGFEQRDGERVARAFTFRFSRTEIDPTTGVATERDVVASVPLLSLLNLPSVALDEAKIDLTLRIVAHDDAPAPRPGSPVRDKWLFVLPAAPMKAVADPRAPAAPTGASTRTETTVAISVTMTRTAPLGLERLDRLLDTAVSDVTAPPSP